MHSYLLGEHYLGFICPRRMPRRALSHESVVSFLLMNILNGIFLYSSSFITFIYHFYFLSLLLIADAKCSLSPLFLSRITIRGVGFSPIIVMYLLGFSLYPKAVFSNFKSVIENGVL